MEAQGKIADFRYTLQREANRVQAPPMLIPDRAAMERFLGACHRRRYPSKTAIIRPGDSANILYYVIDGSLTVSSEDEEGRELIPRLSQSRRVHRRDGPVRRNPAP